MPLYKYKCPKCQHEVLKSMSYAEYDAAGKVICPNCENICYQTISYEPSVIYKGEGFYSTDNKS